MSAWTDAEIDLLRESAAAGLSTAVIAKQIGRGITRNAVIGKARRLGVKLKGPVGFREGNCKGKPSPKPAKSIAVANTDRRSMRKGIVSGNVIAMKREPKPPAPVVIEPSAYDAASRRIPMMELGHRDCRWIVEGSGEHARFCGQLRLEGKPYCQHHKDRATLVIFRSEAAA